MNLLQMKSGSKSYGSKVLFQNANFSINLGEHYGVIGPNGAGKTTLFKLIVNQETLDEGAFIQAQGLRIGYLEQEFRTSDFDVGSCEDFLIHSIQENHSIPLWEIKKLGQALGLTETHFKSSPLSLSGGYKMRMKLLSLITMEPHIMLLDEPTNFLDLESIIALEKFLVGYEKAFLLISHDREFLQKVTDSTLEIESGEITSFPGPIEEYFEHKEQMRELQRAQTQNMELKRKQLESFIERFRAKASKAKQAQSKMKQLERLHIQEVRDLSGGAKILIPSPIPTGKQILALEGGDLGYPLDAQVTSQNGPRVRPILKNVHLRIERGEHLGVVGYNGAGKSTLLKSLAERLPLLKGRLHWGVMSGEGAGKKIRFSYFAQHVSEELLPQDTVLESLQKGAHPDVKAQEILNLTGALLFSGNDVQKPIKVLSGGEKSRVALGKILLQKNPFLILDEPTNHLDFLSVESLTEALRDYEGTLIVVSHDRSFIRRVAHKILEIRDGECRIYPGTYEEYLWSLENGMLSVPREISDEVNSNSNAFDKTGSSSSVQKSKVSRGKQILNLEKEIRELEKRIKNQEIQILRMQKEMKDLNEQISDPKNKSSYLELSQKLFHLGEVQQTEENQMLLHMDLLNKNEIFLKQLKGQ